jgi:hypothetical protein
LGVPVSVDDFRPFVSSLEGKKIKITTENINGLSLLYDEFGFVSLSAQLSLFHEAAELAKVPVMKAAARNWIVCAASSTGLSGICAHGRRCSDIASQSTKCASGFWADFISEDRCRHAGPTAKSSARAGFRDQNRGLSEDFPSPARNGSGSYGRKDTIVLTPIAFTTIATVTRVL